MSPVNSVCLTPHYQASAHTSFCCSVIIKPKKQNTRSEWLPSCIVCYHLLSFILKTGWRRGKQGKSLTYSSLCLVFYSVFPHHTPNGYPSILKLPLTPNASCSPTSEFLLLILPSPPCHTPSLPSSLPYVQLAISPAPEHATVSHHSNNLGMVPMSQILAPVLPMAQRRPWERNLCIYKIQKCTQGPSTQNLMPCCQPGNLMSLSIIDTVRNSFLTST